jgi:hypothetical protein
MYLMHEQVERFPVSMGWRLPDEQRVKVTYQACVVSYEEDRDRWLVQLEQLTDATPPLAQIPAETRALIEQLAGQWIYVPDDARNGITLPLKYETLTRRIRYFYAGDPRSLARGGKGEGERG